MDTQTQRPTQAVILAGGRGTRLSPITNNIPKPMIEFHGKPFLEYLIEMLKRQGFTRILLLLGYLPEVIQNYFKDGGKWGIIIEYSTSPVENETSTRIRLAKHSIDPIFLLMYCDNYWPMQFDDLWERYVLANVQAQFVVYSNTDGYTRDNLRIDNDGYIILYDKNRTIPNLSGVDIGFVILKRSLIDMLTNDNVSFENAVYPKLVENHQLKAYITDHRYYSVGSHDRLPLTDKFLANDPAIFLDRDGVLNKKMARAQYVCSWDEWEWMPGAKEALRLLKEAGYKVFVITNQPGIARGSMSEFALNKIHGKMKKEVAEGGGRIDAIYYCPHGWDDGCDCRKPKPGMLFMAQKDFHLDLTKTIFIGDDERDEMAGRAAGCPTILVNDNYPLLNAVKEKIINDKLFIR